MTFSFAMLVIVLFAWFLFRKSVSRITKVMPEVTTIAVVNLHRAAIVADRHAAVAATASALEANAEAAELCQEHGLEFDGDPINLFDAVVKPHNYK